MTCEVPYCEGRPETMSTVYGATCYVSTIYCFQNPFSKTLFAAQTRKIFGRDWHHVGHADWRFFLNSDFSKSRIRVHRYGASLLLAPLLILRFGQGQLTYGKLKWQKRPGCFTADAWTMESWRVSPKLMMTLGELLKSKACLLIRFHSDSE